MDTYMTASGICTERNMKVHFHCKLAPPSNVHLEENMKRISKFTNIFFLVIYSSFEVDTTLILHYTAKLLLDICTSYVVIGTYI